MRVQVQTLRARGRLLNSDQLKAVARKTGFLRIGEMRDLELGRPMLQARLLDPTRGNEADLLPSLEDARLLDFEKGRMRVTGMERLVEGEQSEIDVAQTWEVTFIEGKAA